MARTPKETVAWCLNCKLYLYAEDIGIRCICRRTLVKRVGYLCQEITVPFGYAMRMPCLMFHRTVKAMKACQHDAY